jgi:hypothetical protein
MKNIIIFLLASMLMMSGCVTIKDTVNYRLLNYINEKLTNPQLTIKDAAEIYETINRGFGYRGFGYPIDYC